MTKKEMFAKVIALVEGTEVDEKAEILEKLNHEVELLANRSSSSKPTATQRANTAILATLEGVMAEAEKPMTITDLMKDERLATYEVTDSSGTHTEVMTNQKLTAMVKKLIANGKVVKTVDKKKSYFSLAE